MSNNQFPIAAAAINLNNTERLDSSSGGIYILLAKKILRENGCVFAVRYTKELETEHYEITSINDLLPSLGAKYVPSKLSGIFPVVRKRLLENKKVLFVGLPCQCAGLKAFLHRDYENLVLIDTVCHGVPSKKVWRKYLNELNDERQVETINMRDKTLGWSNYNYDWKISTNSKEQIIPQSKVPYMKGFVNDLYLRPSCYECQFKGISRVTDITLGDFWGIWDLDKTMDDNKGTSLLLIHSQKGKNLITQLESSIKIKEVSIEDAVRFNPSIIKSAQIPKNRNEFFKELNKKYKLNYVVEKLLKGSLLTRLKNKVRRLK